MDCGLARCIIGLRDYHLVLLYCTQYYWTCHVCMYDGLRGPDSQIPASYGRELAAYSAFAKVGLSAGIRIADYMSQPQSQLRIPHSPVNLRLVKIIDIIAASLCDLPGSSQI